MEKTVILKECSGNGLWLSGVFYKIGDKITMTEKVYEDILKDKNSPVKFETAKIK